MLDLSLISHSRSHFDDVEKFEREHVASCRKAEFTLLVLLYLVENFLRLFKPRNESRDVLRSLNFSHLLKYSFVYLQQGCRDVTQQCLIEEFRLLINDHRHQFHQCWNLVGPLVVYSQLVCCLFLNPSDQKFVVN